MTSVVHASNTLTLKIDYARKWYDIHTLMVKYALLLSTNSLELIYHRPHFLANNYLAFGKGRCNLFTYQRFVVSSKLAYRKNQNLLC